MSIILPKIMLRMKVNKPRDNALCLTLLIILVLLFSGCGTLTQEERDNLDREYKRFQQPPEPYVPSPRDFRRE